MLNLLDLEGCIVIHLLISPKLLGSRLELKNLPNVKFAGQITGVEGCVESAAMGLLAGLFASTDMQEKTINLPPVDTAIGSLLSHLTYGAESSSFQPMNINFGLIPPLEQKIQSKKDRYTALSIRALESLDNWIKKEGIIW